MSEKQRIQHERNRVKKDYDHLFVQIGRRDGFHCQRCETTYHLVIDHIFGLAAGGNSDVENLQLLCAPCNGRKSGSYYDYRLDVSIPYWDFDANNRQFPLYAQYKYDMQAPWLYCKVNRAQCVGYQPPTYRWTLIPAAEFVNRPDPIEPIYQLPEYLIVAPANKGISCYTINSAYGFWGSQGREWYRVDPILPERSLS